MAWRQSVEDALARITGENQSNPGQEEDQVAAARKRKADKDKEAAEEAKYKDVADTHEEDDFEVIDDDPIEKGFGPAEDPSYNPRRYTAPGPVERAYQTVRTTAVNTRDRAQAVASNVVSNVGGTVSAIAEVDGAFSVPTVLALRLAADGVFTMLDAAVAIGDGVEAVMTASQRARARFGALVRLYARGHLAGVDPGLVRRIVERSGMMDQWREAVSEQYMSEIYAEDEEGGEEEEEEVKEDVVKEESAKEPEDDGVFPLTPQVTAPQPFTHDPSFSVVEVPVLTTQSVTRQPAHTQAALDEVRDLATTAAGWDLVVDVSPRRTSRANQRPAGGPPIVDKDGMVYIDLD